MFSYAGKMMNKLDKLDQNNKLASNGGQRSSLVAHLILFQGTAWELHSSLHSRFTPVH